MKISIPGLFLLLGSVQAFHCRPSAFFKYLPPNSSITFAYPVNSNGTFHVPLSDIGYPESPTHLKELCAVQVNVTSSPTSAFSFGLFLPSSWNQRFLAVGNAGFVGAINWIDMAAGVGYGFATMSTDTGHNSTGNDGSWAANSESVIDWGWRAMHGSTVIAKKLTEAYYKTPPRFNYYSGCSTGGRQGLKEVEEFPDDFDGILAGAPAWWTNRLQLWNGKVGTYNAPVGSSHHIPESMFSVIGNEVLRQCDPQDGVVDRIIQDPWRCKLRLEALLCDTTTENTVSCLSNDQLGTLYHIYNDWVETNQTFIFPHLLLGSEAQWNFLVNNGTPVSLGTDYIQYFLGLGKSASETFDYETVLISERMNPGNATADNFDISPFQKRGGKLLHYHGLSDGLIATGSSVYFRDQVARTLVPKGIDVDDFYRLFLVPGMQHCQGTPESMEAPWYFAGANQAGSISTSVHSVPGFSDSRHDALLSLISWVENSTAPNEIIATKWYNDTIQDKVYKQRPLCMYPNEAQYDGIGDINKAESWKCEAIN